jgi:hypothetical protein
VIAIPFAITYNKNADHSVIHASALDIENLLELLDDTLINLEQSSNEKRIELLANCEPLKMEATYSALTAPVNGSLGKNNRRDAASLSIFLMGCGW